MTMTMPTDAHCPDELRDAIATATAQARAMVAEVARLSDELVRIGAEAGARWCTVGSVDEMTRIGQEVGHEALDELASFLGRRLTEAAGDRLWNLTDEQFQQLQTEYEGGLEGGTAAIEP